MDDNALQTALNDSPDAKATENTFDERQKIL